MKHPETLEKHMPTLEHFVVLMFHCLSSETAMNKSCKNIFAQKGREFDKIPPTRDALVLHTKRAIM